MQPGPLEAYHAQVQGGALKPDPAQEKAVRALQRLYGDILKSGKKKFLSFKAPEPVRGIYLYGGVGRGKSMLMDLFHETLPAHVLKRRVHFHAFMIEVHDYIHARRQNDGVVNGVDDVLLSFAARTSEKARVLCFDEFHITDVADAMILGRLFTALFERDVVVVATSNWPPSRLYEGGLQRDRFLPFIELLKSRLEIIEVDSKTDYREQALREEGGYFWPLGEASRQKANLLFGLLSAHAAVQEESVKVKGRTIKAPVANGVARFTFAELCEQPHGAEDYIAIAKAYPTIFLEGVPKMAYDRRNEAKRMMTLIDALYEAKTKLVVTADAPPERLYYGHDHSYEFERTISRLREMQGADWAS